MRRIWTSAAVLVALAVTSGACDEARDGRDGRSTRIEGIEALERANFEFADVRVEYDELGDTSALIIDVGTSVPCREISVFAPDGARIIRQELSAGLPHGVEEVRLQAPGDGFGHAPGAYRIEAVTLNGAVVSTVTNLLLQVLSAPVLLPGPAAPVHPDAVEIAWDPVPEAIGYVVEVESAEAKILIARVLPGSTHFAIPAGVLEPNQLYEVIVQVIAPSGNRTETEGIVTTGPR